MKSLVLQLQADCLDNEKSVVEVLRKALVVARKLSLSEPQEWIEKELKGYKSGDARPPHRLLIAQIRAWNPYHGWVPIIFDNPDEARHLSKCYVGQPVGELDDLIRRGVGALEFPFDPTSLHRFMKSLDVPVQPTRHLDRARVGGILDAVRNMVLDWCLQLEKDGIMGEGLIFSEQEKATASHSNYTINYNAPVNNSQIQQGNAHSMQSMSTVVLDLEPLRNLVQRLSHEAAKLGLQPVDNAQLDAEVRTVDTQLSSPRPNRTVIGEALRSIRNILEGCAGSILATGLLNEIAAFLR
ncbi:MAG: hypothetical protein ACR2JB_13275 [Bryobacteraceae bacterium]